MEGNTTDADKDTVDDATFREDMAKLCAEIDKDLCLTQEECTACEFEPRSDEEFAVYREGKSKEIKSFCTDDNPSQSGNVSTTLDADSSTYNFDNRFRGLVLILNNAIFKKKEPSKDRFGSGLDENALVKSFKYWDFHVIVFNDLTAEQLNKAAEEAANSYKHEEADCFVCVVLSHGSEESREDGIHHVIYGSDWKTISTQDLIKNFDIQGLKGKPKLFFIEACRTGSVGCRTDPGVYSSSERVQNETRSGATTDSLESGPDNMGSGYQDQDPYKAPVGGMETLNIRNTVQATPLYRDSLIMYATPPGYGAWKGYCDKSWLVKELCEFLDEPYVETVSFLRGLTSVSDRVATKYQSVDEKNEDNRGKKEMPVIETMLTKDIRLRKKTPK